MSTHHETNRKLSTADTPQFSTQRFKFSLIEFSGGLGDLGTFIPLAAGMAVVSGMDLGLILIFAGLANIFAGVLFGIPVPVQPMKAIAAVAIADALHPGAIAAAGIITGAVILFLGLTGAMTRIERIVPLSVVRGIQVGVAIKLLSRAVEYITATPLVGPDSVATAVALAALLLFSLRFARFPGALVLFMIGLAISIPSALPGLKTEFLGIPSFFAVFPSSNAWVDGLVHGAVPQIPLTVLNSVIAVCALSRDLFPARQMSSRATAVSVGVINLVTCWFGAMPMCHGSGGLAAQYRFGARTGGSVVMIGVLKMALGLAFGGAAITVMSVFPGAVLGVLLVFAGIELAGAARDQTRRPDAAVMMLTAVAIVTVNTFAGVLFGLAFWLVLHRMRRA